MRGHRFLIALCLLIVTDVTAAAESSDEISFEIPQIDAAKLGWGIHTFPVKIINNSEYLKYVSVSATVKCDGVGLSPERIVVRNYAVYPEDTAVGEILLHIPGNYGDINYELKLYDVVDTLDLLLESQVVRRQSGTISFPVPKGVVSLLSKKITLPPLVGLHIDFDNDFSHILPFLISEGKSVSEIAMVTGCDTSFVTGELDYLISRGYYKKDGNSYVTAIAAIREDEAAKERELAMTVAESVAAKLAENYKSYRTFLNQMVKDSMLTADSNSFLDGGAILYKPYPIVAGLSLWYDLGADFIADGAPLLIFDGTDFCNAHIPALMYMVAGDDDNNGQQLFAFMRNFRSYQFFFGDTIPKIICPEGFMFSPQVGMNVSWEYEREFFPVGFMVDTNSVRPMLDHLKSGMDPIMADAKEKFNALAGKFKKSEVLTGQRYWFWNVVATRTMEILKDKGMLVRRGNRLFRMDGMSAK